MKVDSVELLENGEVLKMRPVCAEHYPDDGKDENNTFARFTPSGSLTLLVNNPELAGQIKPGQEYYIDFSLAS